MEIGHDETVLDQNLANHEYNTIEESIIVALNLANDTLGCALFDKGTGVLQVAKDVHAPDWSTIDQVTAYEQPALILVSSRASEELLDGMKTLHGSFVRLTSSSDYSASSALEKLFELHPRPRVSPNLQPYFATQNHLVPQHREICPGEATTTTMPSDYGALTEFGRDLSIGCAGAILAELGRQLAIAGDFAIQGLGIGVVQVEGFSFTEYVSITPETFQCLQIFRSEPFLKHHQRTMTRSTASGAEHLSLFSLFCGLSHTSQGKTRLREILMRPVSNLDTIECRQKAIRLLLHPRNGQQRNDIADTLSKIRDIAKCIFQLRKGITHVRTGQEFSGSAWTTLRVFISHALKLGDLVDMLHGVSDCELISNLSLKMDRHALLAAGELLHNTIDFAQAGGPGKSIIKTGIDSQLDGLHRQFHGLSDLLSQVAQRTADGAPDWFARKVQCCILLPQLGFLLAIKQDGAAHKIEDIEGIHPGGHWEQIFVANGAVHYKNDIMRQLDAQYGDIHCRIADKEVEVLYSLATRLLQHGEALLSASTACGDLDALLAFALAAEKYKWNVPQLTMNSSIEINKGRHPLQELLVQSFVANDCYLNAVQDLGRERALGHCLVLTGPNQSGKSIYVKQVALIVYLTHIGSFVPADAAVIGVTDRILTRLSTHESVGKHESAFAIDLKQLLHLMEQSTYRSLLVIDEFGKGTNPDDGSGLVASFINHLHSMGSAAPRCLLVTHLHELFESNGVFPAQSLKSAHFRVIRRESNDITASAVTYLFQLQPGYHSFSFGGYCAASNGVPQPIVRRADHLSLLLGQDEDITFPCARLSTYEETALQKAEVVARKFIEQDYSDALDPPGRMQGMRLALQKMISDDSATDTNAS